CYSAELRPLTGLDEPVANFLAAIPQVAKLADDISRFLEDWLPHYVQENRHYLTVAIGCTGGPHRSVHIVQALALRFLPTEWVLVRHRALAVRPQAAIPTQTP